MNCEAYIAYWRGGEVELYPHNIDASMVADLFALVTEDGTCPVTECLLMRRSDSMLYQAFVRTLSAKDREFVCIMTGMNHVLIDDLPDLYGFFRNEMEVLTRSCHLNLYTSHEDEGYDKSMAKACGLLREDFNRRFSNSGSAPGALDYTRRPETARLHIDADGNVSSPGTEGKYRSAKEARKSLEAGDSLIITAEPPASEKPATPKPVQPEPAQPRPSNHGRWLAAVIIAALCVICIGLYLMSRPTPPAPDPISTIYETPEQQILNSGCEGMLYNDKTLYFYKGYFNDNGTDYPVMVAFVESGGQIIQSVYKNVNYGGTIKMDYQATSDEILLSGKDGNNDFTITLHTDGDGLAGVTTDGSKTMSVRLMPTTESFTSKYFD